MYNPKPEGVIPLKVRVLSGAVNNKKGGNMLTIAANAPIESEKGIIKEAEPFAIAVPTNGFEGSFLRQFVMTVLANNFAIMTLEKSKSEKGIKGVQHRNKLFVKLCEHLQYDKWGRFYFDPSQSGKFDPMDSDVVSFFVTVKAFDDPSTAVMCGSEIEEHECEDDDNDSEEDFEKEVGVIPESVSFQYVVYAQKGGVLFDTEWLFPDILKTVRKAASKKPSGG